MRAGCDVSVLKCGTYVWDFFDGGVVEDGVEDFYWSGWLECDAGFHA